LAGGKQVRDGESARRRLSPRVEREKRTRRIVTAVGVFAVIFSVSLVGVGWYLNEYRPYKVTVMKVNGVVLDMRHYVETLKSYGVDDAVSVIEQAELIRQAADSLGVEVTDSEVREELKLREKPITRAAIEVVRPQLLSNKLLEVYFEEQTPLSAPQRQVQALLLESESKANEAKTRIESGEDFGEVASELSLDIQTKENKGNLGWHPKEILNELTISETFGDLVFGAPVGELSEPLYDAEKYKSVGYWLIKIGEKKEGAEEGEEEIHVFAMLLSSEEQAKSIKARLDAGEDFAALAKEFSQMSGATDNGGDLGFVKKGLASENFDAFVFDPDSQEGTLSDPIRDGKMLTSGGYWLIEVLDEDQDRLLSNDDRDSIRKKSYDDWANDLKNDPGKNVEVLITDEQKQWAKERANS